MEIGKREIKVYFRQYYYTKPKFYFARGFNPANGNKLESERNRQRDGE